MARRLVSVLLHLVLMLAAHAESSDAAAEARRVWEQAVEAKGGRARLHAINSAVRTTTAEVGIRGFNRATIRYEELYVPPHRFWQWVDQRPSRFGLHVALFDFTRNYYQMVYDAGGDQPPAGKPLVGHRGPMEMFVATTLLETRDIRPEPVSVRRDFLGFRPVFVLEARTPSNDFEFMFDHRTMLACRVTRRLRSAPGYWYRFDLEAYRMVNGLLLPHVVSEREAARNLPFRTHVEYQLNPDYDPDLFLRSPSIAGGPEQWKR